MTKHTNQNRSKTENVTYEVGYGKPPGHTKWKKGVAPPGAGGRPTPPELREAATLNKIEVQRVFNKLVYLTKSEIKKLLENPEAPMIEITVASILAHSARQGDHQRLNFVLDRLVGKVSDRVEISGADGGPIDARVLAMTHDLRVAEIEKLRDLRLKAGND